MSEIENINEEITATTDIVIEQDVTPPSRGRRSAVPTMYTLEVGQCMVCPPGIPKRPHQTVYYHNALAKKKGTGKVWGVSCRNGVYRIHRLK